MHGHVNGGIRQVSFRSDLYPSPVIHFFIGALIMINIKRIAFTTLISFTSISASASNTNDVNIQVPVNDLSQSSIITDKAHDKNCKKLARKAVWRGIGAAFGVGILATTDNSEEADWSNL